MTPEEQDLQDYRDYQDYLAYQQSQRPESRLDESYLGRLKNNIVAAADAATFGLADEGAAAVRSILPGYGSYSDELNAIRGGMKDYASVHPYQALVSSLIGGAAPVIAAEVASGGTATPLVAKGFGTTVLNGVGTGAKFGGLYGFGSGEGSFTNRVGNAAIDAAAGGLTGGALAAGGYGAAKLVNSAADYLAASRPVGEKGAIILPSGEKPQIDAADTMLIRRMLSTPQDKLEKGASDLKTALAEDSPMFLPEAVDSPSLKRMTRFLAGNESSMDIVQPAVDARKGAAIDRVTSILDELSPNRSNLGGGNSVKRVANEIKAGLEKQRADEAAPLYESLRASKPFKSPEVKDYTENELIQTAMGRVRKLFPGKYKDVPNTDFDLLDKTKQFLDGEIKATDNKAQRRFMTEIRNGFVNAMDAEKPAYREARGVYEVGSTPIESLFVGKEKPLVEILKTKPERVGRELLGMDQENLSAIKSVFGPERAKALKDAVRGALQGNIENKKSNQNLVSDIIDRPAMVKKLKLIIDDDTKFDRLMRLLGRENNYAKSSNLYNPGSTTHGNLQEDMLLSQGASALSKVIKTAQHPFESALRWAESRGVSDQMSERLARILTDTQASSDFMDRALPIIAQRQASNAAAAKVGEPIGQAGGILTPLALELSRRK